MKKTKTSYYCTSCGNETPQWYGRCPACGEWGTVEEQVSAPAKVPGKSAVTRAPKKLSQVAGGDEIRFTTGLGELDRVLGGGAVLGSLVLISGAPGIGKSTLLLQICSDLCRLRSVLYISGEESEKQLKMRALRLGIQTDSLLVLSETNLTQVIAIAQEQKPDVLIVDSIQTLYLEENTSAPGSISQVKECTMALMHLSKTCGITVFVVGHVNKDGAIAGPKVLEHMVDCVLYFEGDRNTSYRLLRAAKNRFGSTNEIGVFEMNDSGLVEVPNPSEMLLAGRPLGTPGTCVACAMEGSRPVLAEVQALVTRSSFQVPRRTTNGFDYNRANLLMAVVEKRGGIKLGLCDAYLNVIGGLYLEEPAADLPVVLAIASSYLDRAIRQDLCAIGEVGLTGELRAVSNLPQRLMELKRLGFTQCIIPRHGTAGIIAPDGMDLIRVKNIKEAMDAAL
ncbi:MAG: DNA repair protein RadA [Ruminococcaceae bacterium]|nr:DNA repair protein RadA [Oscillospiraceae bacterium]